MKLLATLFAGALVLAGCGDSDDGSEGGDTESTATEGAATEAAGSGEMECPGEAGDGGTISVASIGWTEDVAVNALWTELAAACGYEWESTTAEVGSIYTGVADGDFHLFMDAWLPATHADYWEQFGDQITDLNVWYEEAPLTWAVPTYVAEDNGISTIADLADNADLFGGEVTGIESGAGLTRISKEEVMPTYGLEENFTLVESSTSAMLSALGDAIDDSEPIVVTLWEPHSAYAKWDLTNLEDPEGALGEPDEIHTIAAEGFEDEFPSMAGWLSNFTMTGEQISDLELVIEDAGEGGTPEAVQQWISDNSDVVNEWFA
ncbi:glycine betaine ABC transporter substrate-binding protein [Salsipaludibacter albus]|uniref:glycine betaine ABC transporter substrate-binding protein n=1 Tax=Salsipaludibacter albus TaxID=2849650 RepID=UPI001EE4607A|nr:glycine betaine ABC transporter substrate-binding protein [Salsipaludibacter albus]MBY5163173.1 glycine betaine ABC transporter substrate-binding protein [Salsipaludibacter albus]